jgi:hypothetical protein
LQRIAIISETIRITALVSPHFRGRFREISDALNLAAESQRCQFGREALPYVS